MLKYIDEVTFYNDGEEISILEYQIKDSPSLVRIFDIDGTPLQFSLENHFEKIINIYFPKEKPISSGDFRTIQLVNNI